MKATVTATMLDGTTQEASGDIWILGDRVAFERQFQVSSVGYFAIMRTASKAGGDLTDEDGRLRPGAEAHREAHSAFFAYRLLHRAGATAVAFDDWIEQVETLDLEVGEANPTNEVPASGTSQS